VVVADCSKRVIAAKSYVSVVRAWTTEFVRGIVANSGATSHLFHCRN
jgi:hypothetical protein